MTHFGRWLIDELDPPPKKANGQQLKQVLEGIPNRPKITPKAP